MTKTVCREIEKENREEAGARGKRFYGINRNASYYYDPTAYLALSHIFKEEKQERKRQKQRKRQRRRKFHKLAFEPGVSRKSDVVVSP